MSASAGYGMGGNLRKPTLFWRELAEVGGVPCEADDSPASLCEREGVVGSSSKRPTTHCQYRYPSPRRSGPSGSRPTPFIPVWLVASEKGGEQAGGLRSLMTPLNFFLVLQRKTADSTPHKTKQNKGSPSWFISDFFLPPRRSYHSQRVSTATLSGALRALPLVLWWQTALAQAPSLVHSLVVPLARCATRLHASAAKASRQHIAPHRAIHQFDRRAGFFLRGGFVF